MFFFCPEPCSGANYKLQRPFRGQECPSRGVSSKYDKFLATPIIIIIIIIISLFRKQVQCEVNQIFVGPSIAQNKVAHTVQFSIGLINSVLVQINS